MSSINFLCIRLIRFTLIITTFFTYSLSYAQKKSNIDLNISSHKEFDQLKNTNFIFLKKEDGRVEPRKISSTRIEQDLVHGILEIKTRDLSNQKIKSLSFKSNSIVGIDKKGKNISAKMLSIGGILSTKSETGVITRLKILAIRETQKDSYVKKYVVCTTELSESEEVSLASLMADSYQEGDFSLEGVMNLADQSMSL